MLKNDGIYKPRVEHELRWIVSVAILTRGHSVLSAIQVGILCWQADKITTLIKAAGVTVEPYWPGLFAKLFEKRSIGDLITNVGAGETVLFCSFSPVAGSWFVLT